MSKLIKLLLGGTILVGLLFGMVVLAAVMYFDPNDHKDRIIAKVEEETGRTLKLEGDISISYYPWLGLEVSGVTVGNAEGFGDAPFIHADVVALRIKTMLLLKKQYELDTLKLHGVEINLTKNKEGVSNWDDLVREEKDDSEKQGHIKLAAVVLGGVDIKDARFTWDDQSAGQTFKISGMNMSTGELIFGEPIDIKMNLKAESNKPAISADVNMQGTASYDLDAETYAFNPIGVTAKLTGKNLPKEKAELKFNTGILFDLKSDAASIDNLTFNGLGVLIKAQLNVSGVKSGRPTTAGQLSVVGDDLAHLFKVAGIEPLASQLSKLKDRAFNLQTSLSADMGKGNVAISDLNAKLIGAVIEGQVVVSNMGSDTPALKGKLNASCPDLPILLQVAGQFEGGDDPKLRTYGEKLSKAANKKFEVNTEFDADLASGHINVPTLSLKTLGVTIDGHLKANAINSNSSNIDGKLLLRGEKLTDVLAALGQHGLAQNLSTVSMDVAVQGSRNDIKMSPLKAEAIFTGKQVPDSPAKITLNADTKINLDKQALSITRMAVTGLGLNVKADLNVSKFFSESPSVKGKLDARGKDLGIIFRLFGNEPLAKQINDLKKKSFAVKMNFDANMREGNINLPSLSAEGLGLTVNGKMLATDFSGGKGHVDGQLAIKGEDLSAVLTAFDQGALANVLKKISIDIGVKGANNNINLNPLNIRATVAGKDMPNFPVDLTMTANTKMNLDKQTLSVNNIKLNGLGLDLKANISANQVTDKPTFNGDLTVSEFNLRKLMQQMKQEAPITADKKVLTKVALQTKFSGSANSIEFKDFALLLDDTNLKGNLTVKHFTQPRFDFGIGIDNINADRYLPPSVKAGEKQKAEEAATPAADLPLETLRKLNGKGEMLIGKLAYSNLGLSNIKLGINAKDGLVKLDPIVADLYQGKYNGIITVDARGNSLEVKQETQLSGVQIEPLLRDHTQSPESQLAGAANISIKVSSKGKNTLQLKHGLSGQAKLAVTKGILRGIDIRKTLEQAEVLLESKRLGTVKQGGETRFEQLTGTLNIKDGVVKNDDLLMTAPGFRVNGGVDKRDTLGNLRNNSIKYNLSVAVVEENVVRGEENYNIGGYVIPIRCRGSLDDLAGACKPDYGKLLSAAVQKGALDKLGEVINIGISGKNESTVDSGTTSTGTTSTGTTTTKESSQQEVTPESKDPAKELIDKALEGVFDKLF